MPDLVVVLGGEDPGLLRGHWKQISSLCSFPERVCQKKETAAAIFLAQKVCVHSNWEEVFNLLSVPLS